MPTTFHTISLICDVTSSNSGCPCINQQLSSLGNNGSNLSNVISSFVIRTSTALEPYLTQNGPRINIVILEGDIVTSDKKEVAEKLNNYFINSVRNLNIDFFVL